MELDHPIDITAEQRKTILTLLDRHLPNTTTWVYGSRARWTARPQSDLDMVVFTTSEQSNRVSDLREAFEESDLPFQVYLFVWDSVPESFREHVKRDHVVLVEREEGEQLFGALPEDWKQTTLGKVIELKRGYDLPRQKRTPGHIPIVSSSGPTDYHSESKVQGPGVVTGRYGTLGQVFFIPENFWPLNTTLYVRDFKGNDPRFISYFLRGIDFSAYSDKAAVPGLNRNHLHQESVRIPTDIHEQRAIAHILGTLDDKIECNRRMNETLEAMARTLFKSWFLDFDPVHAKAALRRHAAASITPPLGGSRQAQGDSPPARRWGVARRHYPRRALPTARTLRQPQTDAEALLWYYLRDKQLDGYKFRRQHPIGPYIVDFACLSKKVLIELDGGHHAEQREQDEARDRFLRNEGYRVLRFWNNEVFGNCGGVLEAIRAAVQDPPPQPSAPDGLTAATPPQGGSDWSVERARAYLDGMDPGVAALFPDRFEDSELGAVPAGWGVKSLGEVIELAYGKALKAAARKGGPIPVYGSNGQVGWHDKKLVTGPGIVVGRKGNPGVITWVQSDFFPIDTTFYVVPKEGKHSLHFLFYALERQGLADLTADSAVPGLNRNLAYMNKLLIPDDMTTESFNDYAKTLFARRYQLEEEARTLAALRDTLLPKLISGELRVGR